MTRLECEPTNEHVPRTWVNQGQSTKAPTNMKKNFVLYNEKLTKKRLFNILFYFIHAIQILNCKWPKDIYSSLILKTEKAFTVRC